MEEPMGAVNKVTDDRSVVLVGIDFSPQSEDILRAALELVALHGSELHLAHVLSLSPSETFGASRHDRELGYATQIERARQQLDRLAMKVPNSITRLAGHLRIGAPDVEIAQLASDVGADLIIVGAQG